MHWQDQVKRAIGALCRVSYLQANLLPNGKLRRRHVPYSVPDVAQDLIDCLNTDDEERAKAIMLVNGEARRAIG